MKKMNDKKEQARMINEEISKQRNQLINVKKE